MNLFDQINNIDEYIEKIKLRDSQDILLASGHDLSSAGMGMSAKSLRYNPHEDDWSYQSSDATTRYNPLENSWDWVDEHEH
jgi:hypothetical protein